METSLLARVIQHKRLEQRLTLLFFLQYKTMKRMMTMISAKELKDYIETLSTAHAAGHKCDKELRTAIELYTAEIGIKDIETQINEKISKESEKNAKTLLINFAGNYYDSERNEFKLMKAIEVHNDFKKWLEKKQ